MTFRLLAVFYYVAPPPKLEFFAVFNVSLFFRVGQNVNV